MGIREGRLTCPLNSAVVLASCSVQWILLGKLISGHPESSIFTLTYTLLQLRDGLRKVAVGELWCGVSFGEPIKQNVPHITYLRACAHMSDLTVIINPGGGNICTCHLLKTETESQIG